MTVRPQPYPSMMEEKIKEWKKSQLIVGEASHVTNMTRVCREEPQNIVYDLLGIK